MKTIHRVWGEVQIVARFSSHFNIETKQGIKQCHESELRYLAEEGEQVITAQDNEQLLQDMPPEGLLQINFVTPAQLNKKFKQLGKLRCQRLVERAPYLDLDDFVNKVNDLFENSEISRTIGAQMDFSLPSQLQEGSSQTSEQNEEVNP